MCLLNIHLITIEEEPFLCHEVTFQLPFNKSSSLTYSFLVQVQIYQLKMKISVQYSEREPLLIQEVNVQYKQRTLK